MKAAILVLALFAGCSKANPPPGGEKATSGETWSVRDNGKRCIVAPCPTWTATSGAKEVEITGIDLTGAKLAESEIEAARQSILSGKAKAKGSIETVPKAGPAGDGTVLFVVEVVP